ncbi:MAG: hypothetical protein IIV66_02965, partial [Alistipes sp.]|nr:hypothetical protein [Alistipes sp.]
LQFGQFGKALFILHQGDNIDKDDSLFRKILVKFKLFFIIAPFTATKLVKNRYNTKPPPKIAPRDSRPPLIHPTNASDD